jgi:hypothetical protein
MTATLVASKAPTAARRRPLFPSAAMVASAAGMITGHRVPERTLGCTVLADYGPAEAKSRELFPEHYADPVTGLMPDGRRVPAPRVVAGQVDREQVEGPVWRLTVSPGSVSLRSQDPVRRDRSLERIAAGAIRAARERAAVMAAGHDVPEAEGRSRAVTSWSAKSRARMVETIAQLDIAAVLTAGREAAVITLTYPGDWLAVAPDSEVCRRQVDTFRKRYCRRWGVPLVGIWKREFQSRGAPHYHIWTVVPEGVRRGEYRRWIGDTWAAVVGSESCRRSAAIFDGGSIICCERHRHQVAGTAVDWSTGRKSSDPYALGVYFSKHGSFSAKDYQNVAPAEWVDTGSVGRFWGYWGLRKATAGVIVHPEAARVAARVLRRHSRANSYVAAVPAWKYRTVVDLDTGEVSAKWRKGVRRKRVYRMRHGAGYVVHRHAVDLAAQLGRYLDQAGGAERRRALGGSGAGPVGFLP